MSKKLHIKKNDYSVTVLDEQDVQDMVDKKLDIAQGSNKANKNIVTDASGNITTEPKLDISGKEDISNKSSSIFTDSGSIEKYPTVQAVENYAQPKGNYLTEHQTLPELATVATTGSYNDLDDKPDIPTKTSDLNNDSGFLTQHQTLPTIADNLTTNDPEQVLSAKQGKILNENKIDKVNNDNILLANGTSISQSTFATTEQIDNIIAGDDIDLTGYARSADLATVATTGSYNDLDDTPDIDSLTENVNNIEDYLNNDITYAIQQIPTSTAHVLNEGEDGEHPFVSEKDIFKHFRIIKLTTSTSLITTDNDNDTFLYIDDYGEIRDNDVFLLINNSNLIITNNDYYLKINNGNINKILIRGADALPNGTSNKVALCFQNETNWFVIPLNRHNANTIIDTHNYNNIGVSSAIQSSINSAIDAKFGETEYTSNKTNSISTDTGSTTKYPTVSAVEDAIQAIQIPDISGKANTSDLAEVATSGSYNDLDDKPPIPDISGKANISDLATVATTGSYNDLDDKPPIPDISGKEDKSNITQSISASSTTSQYPSAHAVYNAIQAIPSPDMIEITSNKGTASASTMDKFYIEVGSNKRDVYYTEENNGSYFWHKMDADILDELSINWNDITGKPDSFSPSSHAHGELTYDGKLGTTSGKPVITTTGGAITTGSFGTSSGQFAEGNHTHSNYLTSSDISGKADKSGYTANKNLVTNSSGQITTENKPTIPTKTSQLTNDSGFLTNVSASDLPSHTHDNSQIISVSADKITYTEQLTTNHNLNDLTVTGRYYGSGTVMSSLTNGLITAGGILEVLRYGTSANIVSQRFIATNNNQTYNKIYYRARHNNVTTNNGWLDWQIISVDGHTHTKLVSNGALGPTALRFADFKNEGYYTCGSTNSANITDKPYTGNYACIIENKRYDDNGIIQFVYKMPGTAITEIYYRKWTSSGDWTSWDKIATYDDIETSIASKADSTHTHTKSEISDFPTSMTPTKHDDENGNTYGIGSATKFGHCKVINNCDQTSHVGGQVLSAYQGKVLNDKIDANKTTVSDSLTDTSTTNALSANKGNVLSDNVAILAFRTSNSTGGGVFTAPDSLTMSKNGYLYISATNANGNALSGTILIDFNNGANIYSRTLSSGMASLQITNTGTFVLRVFYHKDGSFKGSMIGKVTVS